MNKNKLTIISAFLLNLVVFTTTAPPSTNASTSLYDALIKSESHDDLKCPYLRSTLLDDVNVKRLTFLKACPATFAPKGNNEIMCTVFYNNFIKLCNLSSTVDIKTLLNENTISTSYDIDVACNNLHQSEPFNTSIETIWVPIMKYLKNSCSAVCMSFYDGKTLPICAISGLMGNISIQIKTNLDKLKNLNDLSTLNREIDEKKKIDKNGKVIDNVNEVRDKHNDNEMVKGKSSNENLNDGGNVGVSNVNVNRESQVHNQVKNQVQSHPQNQLQNQPQNQPQNYPQNQPQNHPQNQPQNHPQNQPNQSQNQLQNQPENQSQNNQRNKNSENNQNAENIQTNLDKTQSQTKTIQNNPVKDAKTPKDDEQAVVDVPNVDLKKPNSDNEQESHLDGKKDTKKIDDNAETKLDQTLKLNDAKDDGELTEKKSEEKHVGKVSGKDDQAIPQDESNFNEEIEDPDKIKMMNGDDDQFDDDEDIPPNVEEEVKKSGKKSSNQKPKALNEDDIIPANNSDQIDDEDSFFFVYFMMVCAVFILGYIGYHNKQKVLALVIEGRRGRRSSRRSGRPNSANYHKLDSNLEEAVTSSVHKNTTNIIY